MSSASHSPVPISQGPDTVLFPTVFDHVLDLLSIVAWSDVLDVATLQCCFLGRLLVFISML